MTHGVTMMVPTVMHICFLFSLLQKGFSLAVVDCELSTTFILGKFHFRESKS